jgi:CRP/FNR family cyclic AMP-dependent transcriptional regulator
LREPSNQDVGSSGWWPRGRSGDLVEYLDASEHERLLAAMEPGAAKPGDRVLTKESPSRSLLLVEEGELEIVDEAMGETLVLATIGPGGVVGEVGFVDGEVRTHDVRARTDCRLRRLTRARLLALVENDPALFAKITIALAELLARRFRSVVRELEPVRAFAASLREPMEDEGPAQFEEIDEPLGEAAMDLIRDVGRKGGKDVAGV